MQQGNISIANDGTVTGNVQQTGTAPNPNPTPTPTPTPFPPPTPTPAPAGVAIIQLDLRNPSAAFFGDIFKGEVLAFHFTTLDHPSPAMCQATCNEYPGPSVRRICCISETPGDFSNPVANFGNATAHTDPNGQQSVTIPFSVANPVAAGQGMPFQNGVVLDVGKEYFFNVKLGDDAQDGVGYRSRVALNVTGVYQ